MSIESHLSRPHPSAERLSAYACGDLTGEDAKSVGEHLTRCRDCGRIVLDLQGRSEPDDAELESAWTAMRSRIRLGSDSGAEASGWHRRWPAIRRVAAALLLLAAGISLWLSLRAGARLREAEVRIARLESELAELREPHAQVVEIDLFPRGVLRGDEAPVLAVPAKARLIVLRLLLLPAAEGGSHHLEIIDGSGEMISSLDGIEPDSLGKADVALPRGILAAGVNRLRLVPKGTTSRGTGTEYVVRVDYENPRE